jgi:hypothetical protein
MNRPSTPLISLLLIVLPLVKLAVHLSVGTGYGYHADELYYLACASRLDWSYVDHPPVSIAVLAATRALIGDSIIAIRLVPAIAGALMVWFIGLLARRFGGGAFAVALAMTTAIAAPVYLALDSYFSMNAIDFLVWTVAAWLMVRILDEEALDSTAAGFTRLWVALGILLGIGVANKISVLWLGGGLFSGLVLAPRRALLKTRGPWLAMAIAVLFFVPQIIWQATHDFATVRWMMGAAEERPRAPLAFLAGQLSGLLPIATLVWAAGLVFFFALPQGRRYRPLGWAWLAVAVFLSLNAGTRPYYLAPAFTWLLAAGAVVIEGWSRNRWVRGIAVIYLGAIVIRGIQAAPFVLPVWPQATVAATDPAQQLPEPLFRMSGMQEFVDQLADIYDTLPAAERPRAMILVAYYSIAGAVDLLGRDRHLPFASSTSNNYWFWGPRGEWDGPVIVLGYPEQLLRDSFTEVTYAATSHCAYCREKQHPIYVVRGLRTSPEALWRNLRNRD